MGTALALRGSLESPQAGLSDKATDRPPGSQSQHISLKLGVDHPHVGLPVSRRRRYRGRRSAEPDREDHLLAGFRQQETGPGLPFADAVRDAHRVRQSRGDSRPVPVVQPHPRVQQLAVRTPPRDVTLDRRERIVLLARRPDRAINRRNRSRRPSSHMPRSNSPASPRRHALGSTSAADAHSVSAVRPARWPHRTVAGQRRCLRAGCAHRRPTPAGRCAPPRALRRRRRHRARTGTPAARGAAAAKASPWVTVVLRPARRRRRALARQGPGAPPR